MPDEQSLHQTLAAVQRALADLDSRVRRLETRSGTPEIDLPRPGPKPEADKDRLETAEQDVGALELQVGERWLGPTGVVVLLAGVASFINYPFGPSFPQVLQIAVGFAVAGGMAFLSRQWLGDYPFTARLLLAGGLVILYLAALRLHFFGPDPVVSGDGLGLALLALVPGLGYWLALRRRAQHLLVLAGVLTAASALIGDGAHSTLALLAAGAMAGAAIGVRQRWEVGVGAALVLTYSCHLVWFFSNPVLGHPMRAMAEHHYNAVYIFAYWGIFAAAGLLNRETEDLRASDLVLATANCAGLLVLGTLVGWTHFRDHFVLLQVAMAVACLAAATLFWLRRHNTLATAVYAGAGYMALTVAIVAHFPRQECFLWLGAQSLLVVSTAIWFHSRIIVVANVFIYLGILLAYLLSGSSLLLVNLSYAAVALLSARVMAWQRQRLALRTDALRTTYLAVAFAIIPYGLYHGVPTRYVSLSWLGAACLYFLLSRLLGNRKYRWMAILTMLLTVAYVFVVDLGRLGPALRTVSLLVVGLALTAVSLLYARRRRGDGAPLKEG